MTRWYFRVFTCLRAHTSEASSGVDGSYIRALDQALDSMVDWDGYHEDIFRQKLFRVEQAIFKKGWMLQRPSKNIGEELFRTQIMWSVVIGSSTQDLLCCGLRVLSHSLRELQD